LHDSLIIGFGTSCIIGCWYHGGINMCGSGVNHSNDPICGLNGGFPNGSPLGELILSEFLGCPPFDHWWAKPLDSWVGKWVLTYIVVGMNAVIGCWISLLSILVIGWITIRN
jgi:hypothetical protein